MDLLTPTVRIEQTSRSPHALGNAVFTAQLYSATLLRAPPDGPARVAGASRSLTEHSDHIGSSQTTLLGDRAASFSVAPILDCRKTSDGGLLGVPALQVTSDPTYGDV